MTTLEHFSLALRWTEAAAGLKPVVQAHYNGHQDDEGGPGFDIWTLDEAIPGHPKGSSVSEHTIRKAGFALPNRRT